MTIDNRQAASALLDATATLLPSDRFRVIREGNALDVQRIEGGAAFTVSWHSVLPDAVLWRLTSPSGGLLADGDEYVQDLTGEALADLADTRLP